MFPSHFCWSELIFFCASSGRNFSLPFALQEEYVSLNEIAWKESSVICWCQFQWGTSLKGLQKDAICPVCANTKSSMKNNSNMPKSKKSKWGKEGNCSFKSISSNVKPQALTLYVLHSHLLTRHVWCSWKLKKTLKVFFLRTAVSTGPTVVVHCAETDFRKAYVIDSY